MMRCLTRDQKILYQQYAQLGKEVLQNSNSETGELKEIAWVTLSNEGIWSLPIAKQYGGQGLSWQDCSVALDGFFNQYANTQFLTLLISQMSSLFLIAQYGTSIIKQRYLPRLIQGEMASLFISKDIHSLLPRDMSLSYKKKNSSLSWRNKRIYIHARKINSDIIFSIQEKQLKPIAETTGKSMLPIMTRRHDFIAKNIGLSALCDLINFERLLYGVLSASYINKLKSQMIEE